MNWTRLATAALFVAAVPALAQNVPVRISKPAPEQTVRGSVPISINAASVPNTGYMIVEINDKFVAAVAGDKAQSSLTYFWDTKTPIGDDPEAPRDGQYTIRVKTFTSDFTFARSNELNVYLKNHISIAANKGITLAYRFRPDDSFSFVEKVTAKAGGVDIYSAEVPWSIDINDVTGGVAEAREKIGKTAIESVNGTPQLLPVAGRSFVINFHSNGAVTPGPRMKRAGAAPMTSLLRFPGGQVRVGDTWTNDMTITPFYNNVTSAKVSATHKLAGLEYYGGQPSAKIVSNVDGDAVVTNQGVESTIHFKGTRVSYFNYQKGRLLHAVDTMTADFAGATGGGNPLANTTVSTGSVNLTIVTAVK